MRKYPLIMLAGTLLLAGCGGGGSSESKKIVEGEEVSKNPIGLAQQMMSAGQNMQKMQEELAAMKPVDPLNFKELLPFLPEPMSGWQAEDPHGETNSMGAFSLSQVDRAYSMGDQHIKVQIVDWAYRREMYAPFFLAAAFSQESSDGYSKGIMVGEDPGREEYKIAPKSGTMTVLVGKRFMLTIQGDGIEAEALRAWFDHVDTAALRAKAA